MEKVYIGFQNIVKITKSLHNFVTLITQQCVFPKRDMKVEGEGARENGLTRRRWQEKGIGGMTHVEV